MDKTWLKKAKKYDAFDSKCGKYKVVILRTGTKPLAIAALTKLQFDDFENLGRIKGLEFIKKFVSIRIHFSVAGYWEECLLRYETPALTKSIVLFEEIDSGLVYQLDPGNINYSAWMNLVVKKGSKTIIDPSAKLKALALRENKVHRLLETHIREVRKNLPTGTKIYMKKIKGADKLKFKVNYTIG